MPRRPTPRQQRQIEKELKRSTRKGSFRQSLNRRFGGIGGLLNAVIDVMAGGAEPTGEDIDRARATLEGAGYRVSATPPPLPPPRAGAKPPPLPKRRAATPPPLPRTRPARGRPRGGAVDFTDRGLHQPADVPEPVDEMEQLPARVLGRLPDPSALPELTPEIETPQSSNVYAIQYDRKEGILYVTFKAEGQSYATNRRLTNICDSSKTATVRARPHVRGPTYSYGGRGRKVPETVWQDMVNASSKGQAVWALLRVCGSAHAHQYPYTLTKTASDYVPRKATRRGFATRRLPTVAGGRRGSRPSTLPPQVF